MYCIEETNRRNKTSYNDITILKKEKAVNNLKIYEFFYVIQNPITVNLQPKPTCMTN